MRSVVQRVAEASVTVEDQTVGEIGAGILALIGVHVDDTPEDARYIAEKLVHLRIFEDAEGRMNLSLAETGGQALLVSQFTLYGDARRGRRPGFTDAARGDKAEMLYALVCDHVRQQGITVAQGRFGNHMRVQLVNDGPVTLLLDSRKQF